MPPPPSRPSLQAAASSVCDVPLHAPLLLPPRLVGAAVRGGLTAVLSPWSLTRVPSDVLTHAQRPLVVTLHPAPVPCESVWG